MGSLASRATLGHPEGRLLQLNSLLTLATVLVAGLAAGGLAKRLRLPAVTGQIVVGMLLGHSVVGLIGHEEGRLLRPVIDFALGLMAVAVGSHLRFRRLRNARLRLGLLVLCEAVLTPALVVGVVLATGAAPWPAAILLGAICVSTAPATILALVSEARARGVFVKTLLAGVALNNLACIALFEVARSIALGAMGPSGGDPSSLLLQGPLRQLGLAAVIGTGVGFGLVAATRRVLRPDRTTAMSLVAILLVVGLATDLGVSALLAGLFLGMSLANLTPLKEEIGHVVFADFDYAIFAVFFTLAGAELSFEHALKGGILALLVFAARFVGKVTSARVSMRLAKAIEPVRKNLGFALIPQAGLAVGLMLLVTDDPTFSPIREVVLTVVLSVVLLNELIGPVLARRAILRSGEAQMGRPRVLDFLNEEHIVTGLVAGSLEEAIAKLADHLSRTRMLKIDRATLVKGVLERERLQSTCLGEGLAIPHARLPTGSTLAGVMGLCPSGIPAETPDGLPLRCVVLLVTPEGERDRHLLVLAALAKAIGSTPDLRESLFHAESPAHAYALLHASDEAMDFNYFLDDPAEAAA